MPRADQLAGWARSLKRAGSAELAELDRRLLAVAPDVLADVERAARGQADAAASSGLAQDGVAAMARIAARVDADHPRAGCASLLLTGALLLPITVALALFAAGGAVARDDAVAVGGVLAAVSGAAALVLLVAALASPRLLQPLPRIAIGSAGVGVVTAAVAGARIAGDPSGGSSAVGMVSVIVVAAALLVVLAVVDSVRRVRMHAAQLADTAADRAIADPYLAESADARRRALDEVRAAVGRLDAERRRDIDSARTAALDVLVRRGLLPQRRARALASETVGALLLVAADAPHPPSRAPRSA